MGAKLNPTRVVTFAGSILSARWARASRSTIDPERLDHSLVVNNPLPVVLAAVSLRVTGTGEGYDRAFKQVVVQLPAAGPVPRRRCKSESGDGRAVIERLKEGGDEVDGVLSPMSL